MELKWELMSLYLDEHFQSVQRVPEIILCETACLLHSNMKKKLKIKKG